MRNIQTHCHYFAVLVTVLDDTNRADTPSGKPVAHVLLTRASNHIEAEPSEGCVTTFTVSSVKSEPLEMSPEVGEDQHQPEETPEITKRRKMGRTTPRREAVQYNFDLSPPPRRKRRGSRPKKEYLSESDEASLVKFVRKKMKVSIGCTRQELFDMAVKLAERRGTPFPDGRPTVYWLHSFRKKNPGIALRHSKETKWYSDRTARSTEPFLTRFTKLLTATGLRSQPAKVWTMDDRGLQLSVGAQKITTIVCGSADGAILPPFVIFPLLSDSDSALSNYDTERAPEGTQISMSDSSWTGNDIIRAWFETSFLPKIGPERPQILIYGGYEDGSHSAIPQLAQEHGLHSVALPAQTSNWTQPLVRSVFRTFTSALFAECDRLTATRGQELTNGEFFRVFSAAWRQMTPADLRKGFSDCGIELPFFSCT